MNCFQSPEVAGRVLVALFAAVLGAGTLAAPAGAADPKPPSETAAEEAGNSVQHGAIVKNAVLRSESCSSAQEAPACHPRVERMSLDEQVEFAGKVVAAGLLQCCDPVWLCNLGCRVADNSCMAQADRREARCAREIGARCASSAKCRERHLQECAAVVDRGQCMSGAGNCTSCCDNGREGAFNVLGINQCVQRNFLNPADAAGDDGLAAGVPAAAPGLDSAAHAGVR